MKLDNLLKSAWSTFNTRILKHILLLSIVFYCSHCSGQSNYKLERLTKHTFTDGNIEGPIYKFRHVFENNARDLSNFNKYNKTRNTQKIINYALVGFVGTVTIYDHLIKDQSCSGFDCPGILTSIAAMATGAVFFLSNVILIPIKVDRKNRLLREHNSNHTQNDSYGMRNDKLLFELCTSHNGIGITLKF